jgi:hypothetical protein
MIYTYLSLSTFLLLDVKGVQSQVLRKISEWRCQCAKLQATTLKSGVTGSFRALIGSDTL